MLSSSLDAVDWQIAAATWIDPPPDTHPNSTVERVAYSPDGRHLMGQLHTPYGPQVMVYDAGGLELVGRAEGTTIGVRVADDLFLASRSTDGGYGLVLRRSPPDGEVVGEIGEVEYCYALAGSADGSVVAVAGFRTVELWSVAGARRLATIEAHVGVVDAVDLSPDGRVLAARCGRRMSVWDAATGERTADLTGLVGKCGSVRFSPDGRWLASGYDRSNAGLWRVADLSPRLLPVERYQMAVAWSPDATLLATAGQRDAIRLWRPDTDQPLAALRGPDWVTSLAFAPDGGGLAAASGQRIHLWRAAAQPPAVPRPTWDPLLMPLARASDPLEPVPSVSAFVERLGTVEWFRNVARPSPWDHGCVRLSSWDSWPGPESEAAAISHDEQRWIDAIHLVARTYGRPDLTALYNRVSGLVVENVEAPDSDDPYDGRNAGIAQAAGVAAVIACFLELGWPVPADLEERWAWFAAGYWPCGYVYDNPAHHPPYRLLVL